MLSRVRFQAVNLRCITPYILHVDAAEDLSRLDDPPRLALTQPIERVEGVTEALDPIATVKFSYLMNL